MTTPTRAAPLHPLTPEQEDILAEIRRYTLQLKALNYVTRQPGESLNIENVAAKLRGKILSKTAQLRAGPWTQEVARRLAAMGRGGDSEIAHVTPGELVLHPSQLSPETLARVVRDLARRGIALGRVSVGSADAPRNPHTGAAEFDPYGNAVPSPEDEPKMVVSTNGRCESSDPRECDTTENDLAKAAAQGVTARAAAVGIETGALRSRYGDDVRKLDPLDDSGRSDLKKIYRDLTPRELREYVEKKYPDRGPRTGSIGRANVTNAAADRAARMIGRAGRGLAGVGSFMAAHDIATSTNPLRAAVANAGAIGGGVLGGVGGGLAGMLTGPAAPITAPSGSALGSAAGGAAGYEAGNALYDFFGELRR